MTTIFVEEGGCVHPRHDPPFGSFFGLAGELRQCPECKRWWKRIEGRETLWRQVGFFDFAERKAIKNYENRMHTIVSNDRKVEDV